MLQFSVAFLCHGTTPAEVLPLDCPKKHAEDAHANTYLAAHVYTKLSAWELMQYAVVLYPDLDTLVVGQFSPLFEVHQPQMRACCQTLAMGRNTHPDGLDYNSGVILLVPYLALFATLVQGINNIPHNSLDTTDQALLNVSAECLPLAFSIQRDGQREGAASCHVDRCKPYDYFALHTQALECTQLLEQYHSGPVPVLAFVSVVVVVVVSLNLTTVLLVL
jgi:hypothetical protein